MTNYLFPQYTKLKPSPAHALLIKMYSDMHEHGMEKFDVSDKKFQVNGEDVFPGKQTLKHADQIKQLCDKHSPESLFDFGSGKAGHYDKEIMGSDGKKYNSLKEYWSVKKVVTYEPALGTKIPNRQFDAVICTDVIEHIFIGDVFWTIEEIFKKAKKFVYLNISCDLTSTLLPNGENVHITVRDPEFWHGVVDAISSRYPDVDYKLACGNNLKNDKIFNKIKKSMSFFWKQLRIKHHGKQYKVFTRIDHNSLGGKFTT